MTEPVRYFYVLAMTIIAATLLTLSAIVLWFGVQDTWDFGLLVTSAFLFAMAWSAGLTAWERRHRDATRHRH